MQFITVALALAASVNAATILKARQSPSAVCPALDTPQCCQVDVDGILDLTCEAPSSAPTDAESFKSICASSGTGAYCCTVPLDGDGLLCTAP